MSNLHIHAPKGSYIGQVRKHGCRKWQDAHGTYSRLDEAIAASAFELDGNHRLRVIFVDDAGWYEPLVVFEGARK